MYDNVRRKAKAPILILSPGTMNQTSPSDIKGRVLYRVSPRFSLPIFASIELYFILPALNKFHEL